MAEKGLLLYDNALWRPGVTLTASSEASGSTGVANLLDYRPKRRWHTTAGTGQSLLVDFGAPADIDTILIYAGEFSIEGALRARLADNGAMTAPALDQTFEIWPPVTGFGENFGLGFGGYPDLSAFKAFAQRRVIRLGSLYSQRYLRLDFDDSERTDLRIGIVMAGNGLQCSVNFRFGHEWDHVDPTEHVETDGGSVLIQARESHRELNFAMALLDFGEAITRIDDVKRIVGRKRPAFWLPYPDGSTSRIYRTSAYGLLTKIAPVRQTHAFRAEVAGFTLRELT